MLCAPCFDWPSQAHLFASKGAPASFSFTQRFALRLTRTQTPTLFSHTTYITQRKPATYSLSSRISLHWLWANRHPLHSRLPISFCSIFPFVAPSLSFIPPPFTPIMQLRLRHVGLWATRRELFVCRPCREARKEKKRKNQRHPDNQERPTKQGTQPHRATPRSRLRQLGDKIAGNIWGKEKTSWPSLGPVC